MPISKQKSGLKLVKPKTKSADTIDEASKESFPASDAPAWTVAKKFHKKFTANSSFKNQVKVKWQRKTASFDYENYNRNATLEFAGGKSITVSNPPQYFGEAKHANSEELLIAAVSCCYMQTFLAVASKQGYKIKSYEDNSCGFLGINSKGAMSITEIELSPKIKFEGIQPSKIVLENITEKAKENCFISNSVCAKISINPKLVK